MLIRIDLPFSNIILLLQNFFLEGHDPAFRDLIVLCITLPFNRKFAHCYVWEWRIWEKMRIQAFGANISVMESDFHIKSRLSPSGWGSLWYKNRANPFCSRCYHVFILPTRCPFINLWLILALCLKGLVLNRLMADSCCRSSNRAYSVSHRSFEVLNSTKVALCNPKLLYNSPPHPLEQNVTVEYK